MVDDPVANIIFLRLKPSVPSTAFNCVVFLLVLTTLRLLLVLNAEAEVTTDRNVNVEIFMLSD